MWIRTQGGTLLNTVSINSFTVRDAARFEPSEARSNAAQLVHVATAERRGDAIPISGALDRSTAQAVLDALAEAFRRKSTFFDVADVVIVKPESEAN
jgi:molybdopterin-guanine dinucleotide biosynthesis protein A